jgi:hypothetical protein
METVRTGENSSLLLISGASTTTQESLVFGFFSLYPQEDELGIKPAEAEHWRSCLMFQLAPMQDVFQGRIGQPAWKMTDEKACFGDTQNGVSMSLPDGLRRGKIVQRVSKTDKGTYESTTWRGDWEAEMNIDLVEVWTS